MSAVPVTPVDVFRSHLQWVGLYVVASVLVGLAVTYYYDDPSNAKLNTILERGLQLGGLALVCSSRGRDSAANCWTLDQSFLLTCCAHRYAH